MGMGPHGADDSRASSLPVIDEEPDEGSQSPEMMVTMMTSNSKISAERRKAIASRMRELLRRAAAAESAHTKLRLSTVATAKKWKRVVGRIQNRGGHHQRVGTTLPQDDGDMSSSASSISSKSSFSWDAAAETSCSSPLNNFSPATSIVRLSCSSARISSGSDDEKSMAHWVTTDSEFVVLEL